MNVKEQLANLGKQTTALRQQSSKKGVNQDDSNIRSVKDVVSGTTQQIHSVNQPRDTTKPQKKVEIMEPNKAQSRGAQTPSQSLKQGQPQPLASPKPEGLSQAPPVVGVMPSQKYQAQKAVNQQKPVPARPSSAAPQAYASSPASKPQPLNAQVSLVDSIRPSDEQQQPYYPSARSPQYQQPMQQPQPSHCAPPRPQTGYATYQQTFNPAQQTQQPRSRVDYLLSTPGQQQQGGHKVPPPAPVYVTYDQPPQYVPVIVQDPKQAFQRSDDMARSELHFDPIHPPPGYFSTLSTAEVDPRNYKHVPNIWMNRIPYAGKALQRDDQSIPLLG